MNKRSLKNLEPRTTKEITDILSEIQGLLSLDMFFMMMQPNVILAIAGIKPLADMCDINPEDKSLDRIDEINQILRTYGLELYVIIKPESVVDYGGYFGGVKSLKGLERATTLSNFPFITKYKFTNKPNDFSKWKETMKLKYQKEVDLKHFSEKEISMIRQGMEMGYPDQAILDLLDYYKLNKENRINIPAFISYVKDGRVSDTLKDRIKGKEIYVDARLNIPREYVEESPLPLFSYNYKSRENNKIKNWVYKANQILDGFYNSEWYKTYRIFH